MENDDVQKVIYKPGEMGIQTTVTNGFCEYSDILYGKAMKPEEYIEFHKNDGLVCIGLHEAMKRINALIEEKIIKHWHEITGDQWDYALDVLPPKRLEKIDNILFFQMSEKLIADVTATYAAIAGKYYMASRRTGADYHDLANEIREQFDL